MVQPISLTADDAFKMQLQSLLGGLASQKEIYQERKKKSKRIFQGIADRWSPPCYASSSLDYRITESSQPSEIVKAVEKLLLPDAFSTSLKEHLRPCKDGP